MQSRRSGPPIPSESPTTSQISINSHPITQDGSDPAGDQCGGDAGSPGSSDSSLGALSGSSGAGRRGGVASTSTHIPDYVPLA